MAAMAASLMCCGVAKWGSPAPKSTTSMSWPRSLSASATTAIVEEGSMRLIRSVSFKPRPVSVATVISFFLQLLLDQLRDKAGDGPSQLGNFTHQARTQVRVGFGRHHEHSFQVGRQF